ncbi:MAG: choice-of-anchor J domain-containing protein, partial [Bacteroidales bacterium]|nr:choice-of-anchor J domain-containing protein [Bacteroidales bacterium]
PESLSESLVLGTSSSQMVTVSNTGNSALEFELSVTTGSVKSVVSTATSVDFTLPSGGDRSNPTTSSVVATPVVWASGSGMMRSSFSEGFDDITTLPAAGWALINKSAPVGTTSWFQASATAPFPAHSGAATSYIGANFNNTAGTGTISNWLLTPETTFENGHTMSFWTRVPTGSSWPDRLEVRLSTSGASQNVGTSATDVGDFTTVLLSVNPDLTVGGYPDVWTQYTATISGLAAPVSGRIAFRYFVTGGGPSGNNSNYIGIDSFEYTGGGVTPPDSWLTAAPLTGTLAAGASMDITVGFSTADLTVGSYQGSLVFSSNDPVTPTLTVPVSLTVTNPVVSDFPAPRNLTVVDAILAAQLSWQAPDLGGGTTEDFYEGFESGTLPTGWVTYDVDGDGYIWDNTALEFAVFDAHTGLYCMTSASYRNDVGALTPNNWLVTPPIAVTATSELSFWVDAQDPAWSQEQYYVKVSTTGNAVADFTTTVHSAISPAAWAEVVVDLSAFAGQTIYIAFQHANVTDMFFIKIDDVTVTNTVTKAAYTAPVAAGPGEGIYFRTSGMSQSEIDARLNPQTTYVYGEAAETTTIGGQAQIIPSGVKHMSGSRNRTLLHDNGPFINSPGTGPNGTDQSILQNVTLGMNTLGAGIQFASGNRMADDIVVDQTWTVETITVYTYQTGSPTTSTITGGYVQVWDGDPTAGGQVIWGDVVTNRMASTAWTNSYRLSEGTPGTTRPIMSVVMATPGLVLEPGTYWIDYTLAGSLASGPWAPPITINGQAVTGNAKQFLGASSVWQDWLDTGTDTPAQGLPFLIEGTAGGGGGGDYNLTGYNIYRDGTLIATNATTPRTYLDAPLAPGTYTYGVSALYDQPSVGESDPVMATVTISSVVDINMQNGTITICEGNFYDSGGATGQYQNSENLTLTFLPSTAGAKMKFNFVEFNTEANYDFLKVYDGPNTSSPQIGPATGFNGVGVPALLAELVATNAQGAITFHFTSDASVQRDGWKALISCFTPADVDLEAKSVSGNITPSVGTASTYNVEVKNLGSTTQSTYTVKLMQAGGVELNSVAGPTITAGQTLMVPLSWTPTAQGPTSIYGVVEVAGDGNPQNNTSPSLNVTVQPEGVVAITIGVGNVLPTFRIPFDFYWKNSLSQTIYYPEELENIGGALLGLNYYNNFATNLPGKAVKIWVGTTAMADLSQGWADPSGFTLVFDGTVDFPIGSNVIYIPFSQPYIYGGGNLVVYTNRVWEDVYFNTNDKFYATETANKPNRTRHVQLDATVFDPMNPPAPAAAQLKNWHPNTTLFFNTSGLGALQGVVSSSGQPVEGVKVQVDGTSTMTHTNAQGQYNFPYLLPGNINVTASKFGYVAQTLPTTIVVDQTTTLNFNLQGMPTVTVSGFVAGSDAPTVGLAGAQVSLEGYENYQATTNASGMFSIPGVYASNTYAVEVSAAGYADYSGTAVVGTTNLVLPNIILQEVMAPPANLTANISATNPNLVNLAWNMQQDVEFRYDDGVRLAQLGSSTGTLNTVLGSKHTTSAVLTEMSWLLSDASNGGGPHNTIKIYVFGLTGAGIPNGSNVLYSATVSNTDGVWNTHTFPTPVTANGGFFLGVAYAGFVGLGTDDGIGTPYVFQPNTHYFVGDYTAGGWETWETYNFLVNGMIRGKGVPGGKVSYAVNETPAPQVTTANSGTLELTKLAQPVASGEPNWTAPADHSRSLLGFNIYKNGQVMAAMVQTMNHSYTEMQMGVHCYHVTAMYGSGESAPSNQACVDILVGINELADASTSIYPNPAKSSLTIESLPMSRLTVINALGQTVLDMEMNKLSSLVLNVEGWDAGVYMLRIVTSEGIVTKRATIVK